MYRFTIVYSLLQKKHKRPIVSEVKIDYKKDSEFGDRPMTKKEKEEFLRERESKLRKAGKSEKVQKQSTSGETSSFKKTSEHNSASQLPAINQRRLSQKSYEPKNEAKSDQEKTSHNKGHKNHNNSTVQKSLIKNKLPSDECHLNSSKSR